ncbi:MAG: hypothetical protein R3C11_04870 [Planctomycetaceae bacterium]
MLLTMPVGVWISVLGNLPEEMQDIATQISREVNCSALRIWLNDSDSWGYTLFIDGEVVDKYDSMTPLYYVSSNQVCGDAGEVNPDTHGPDESFCCYDWRKHYESISLAMPEISEKESSNIILNTNLDPEESMELFLQLLFIPVQYAYYSYEEVGYSDIIELHAKGISIVHQIVLL